VTFAGKAISALIAPASFAIVATTLIRTNNWAAWGIEALPAKTPATVSFGDLANITATADCLANQIDVEACDPYGRSFQPYVVLPARILNFFNLGLENTGALGIALAAIFFLTITALSILIARSWTKSTPLLFAAQALLALVAISPPSMLAIERGQIEQLTLALVVAALLAFSAKHTTTRYVGSLTSLVATGTKYLSVGMFLPFINRSLFTKANKAVLIGLALSAVFLFWSISDVLLATNTSGASTPQTTKSAFSVTTLLATVYSPESVTHVPSAEVVTNWSTIKLASYAIFIALVITWIAILKIRRTSTQSLPTTSGAWILTLGAGGVLLFPYLLGNSHDYRLIFLIPLLTGSLLLSQENKTIGITLTIAAAIAAITSASMIATPNGWELPTPLMILGDAALMVLLSGITALWATTALSKPTAQTR
jgi:hypothetical protein